MRRLMLRLIALTIAVVLWGAPVWAHGPEIGFNGGVAIPLDKYRKNVDGQGGTFGLDAGYRFDLTDTVKLSFLANPQFTFMPTEEGCCRGKNDHETGTTFSITSGPRLSFLAGLAELYIEAKGGYYRDMSGPMSDDGIGFNAGGGLDLALGDSGARIGV